MNSTGQHWPLLSALPRTISFSKGSVLTTIQFWYGVTRVSKLSWNVTHSSSLLCTTCRSRNAGRLRGHSFAGGERLGDSGDDVSLELKYGTSPMFGSPWPYLTHKHNPQPHSPKVSCSFGSQNSSYVMKDKIELTKRN